MPQTHVVKQGEYLSLIAKKYGIAHWRTIYDDPANADFRTLRPNPNLIFPGDEIIIPDAETKEEPGETARRHRFTLRTTPEVLRLKIADCDPQGVSVTEYSVDFGTTIHQGTAAPDEVFEVPLPPDAQEATLTAKCGNPGHEHRWTLQIGHLDPVEELSGVQARLNNLQFESGPVDGIDGPKTQAAVKAFQKKYGLKVDGIAGPITQGKLAEVHGC